MERKSQEDQAQKHKKKFVFEFVLSLIFGLVMYMLGSMPMFALGMILAFVTTPVRILIWYQRGGRKSWCQNV